MPLDEYLLGLAFFAGTVGAVGTAAGLLVRRRLSHLSGAEAVLAFATLATAGIVVVHLLPGLVGQLSRVSALLCAVAALAAVTLFARGQPDGSSAEPAPGHPPSGPVSWALAAVALGVLAAGSAAAMWSGSVAASVEINTLTFHLPNVARWIQTGTFWRVDQFTPLLANGNYPHNGDVVFLSVVLPWESDALVRAAGVPFAAIAGLAVYAIAARCGAARATAALFGTAFCAVPVLLSTTHEGAKTDAIMLAAFGAGILFLLRHFAGGRRSDLVLAGLGLGLAFGTKWYGVTSVAAVIVLWAGAWLWERRPARELLVNGALLSGLVALAGGFWLLRNWVESGNPVFPIRVAPLGLEVFDAPRDFVLECGGSTVADYVARPAIWREFILPAYRAAFGLPGLLIAGVWAFGAALLVRGRKGGERRRRASEVLRASLLFLAVAPPVLAAVYAITPASAFGPDDFPAGVGSNARWLLPAALVAAALGGWAASRAGRMRTGVEAAALVAVLDGVRRGFSDPAHEVLLAGLGLGVAAVVALGALGLARHAGVKHKAIPLAVLAVGLVAVTAAGHARQQDFHEHRYRGTDPVVSWFAERAPSGQRVGLAGVWSSGVVSPVLPAFGPGFGNEVAFVGTDVEGQLREFERRSSFLAALDRGGYDLLVVGRGDYGECAVPGREGDENEWATAAGFERLAESAFLVLYRVPSEPG